MFVLSFETDILKLFSSFIALYLDEVRSISDIREFIEAKCEEK